MGANRFWRVVILFASFISISLFAKGEGDKGIETLSPSSAEAKDRPLYVSRSCALFIAELDDLIPETAEERKKPGSGILNVPGGLTPGNADAASAAIVREFAINEVPSTIEVEGNEDRQDAGHEAANGKKKKFRAGVYVDRGKAVRAVNAMQRVFGKTYGVFVAQESPHISDRLMRGMRSTMALFDLVDGQIPNEIYLGFLEKGSKIADRLQKKVNRIRELRAKLGPSVEFLTPDALTSLLIAREIGRARVEMRDSPRDALKPIAQKIATNQAEAFRHIESLKAYEDSLRQLVVLIADLVLSDLIKPLENKKDKAALHDLFVALFCPGDSYLADTTYAQFQAIAQRLQQTQPSSGDAQARQASDKARRQGAQLATLATSLKDMQFYCKKHLQGFALTYHQARIARAYILRGTQPHGRPGMPFNSLMQHAAADLSHHPGLLNLAVETYGDDRKFLSMTLGDTVRTGVTTYEMWAQSDGNADRKVAGRVISRFGGEREFGLFTAGEEYRLDSIIELLETEERANSWWSLGNWLSTITGPLTGKALGASRWVKGLGMQQFADRVQHLSETGELEPTIGPDGKPIHQAVARRQRKIVQLPLNLPATVSALTIPADWRVPTPPPAVTAGPEAQAIGEGLAEVNRDQPAGAVAEPVSEETSAASPEPPVVAVAREPELARSNGNGLPNPPKVKVEEAQEQGAAVDVYFTQVLKVLNARADVLYREWDQIAREMDEDATIYDPSASQEARDALKAKRDGFDRRMKELGNKVSQLFEVTMELYGYFQLALRRAAIPDTDIEETMAWHLVQSAPLVAGWVALGPPEVADIGTNRGIAAMVGLSWRVVDMGQRMMAGDGQPDENLIANDPNINRVEPALRSRMMKRRVVYMLVGGAIGAAGLWWSHDHGVLGRWDPINLIMGRSAATAPENPGASAPAENVKPKIDPNQPTEVQ